MFENSVSNDKHESSSDCGLLDSSKMNDRLKEAGGRILIATNAPLCGLPLVAQPRFGGSWQFRRTSNSLHAEVSSIRSKLLQRALDTHLLRTLAS